ncbi:hypothetical protein DV735_g1213, partial [Chaetothyriales sp. CBS 134920]
MGVTGLWTVVAPTARPTSLASLNRKRLAVDASIWIYQFLKAVRDKEGNALRNSHVVGFFRRICKLLYFGIKPVFVFDGGAPALKRETVLRRRRRREGRRDDAVRTAAKLVSVQMERAAAAESRRARKRDDDGNRDERRQAFRKTDQYHLPDLDVSIESLRGADDPRIMSQAELEDYARQFHSGEDVNLYDFSKIDFESPFFLSLPAGDRYNILNAARLRSRLRMGYSKEQLDAMFPDRMAFSKFQIERVKERNELTQRLMHINGMTELNINQGGRIAGEKGKEYVLVRNEGVDGGWALGVGLNRLPRAWKRKRKEVDYDMTYEEAAAEIARKRKAVTSISNLKPTKTTIFNAPLPSAALAESRKSKAAPPKPSVGPKFDGPLPFESLNLGQSLLGKKKASRIEEDLSGGFERNLGDDTFRKERPPQPMPSWFEAASRTEDLRLPRRNADKQETYSGRGVDRTDGLRSHRSGRGTAVNEQDEREREQHDREMHEWEMPEEVERRPDAQEEAMRRKEEQEREERYRLAREIADEDDEEFEDVEVENPAPSALAQLQQHVTSAVASAAAAPDPPIEQYFLPDDDEEVDAGNNNKAATSTKPEEDEFGSDDDDDDAEEAELMRQLAIEAEEHARFANSLNNTTTKTTPADQAAAAAAAAAARDYDGELQQLRNQQKRDRRDADEVTQVMIQECQALLSLFGLPYMTAPMEAEAQCAELVHLGLVDGIVTDDSDIFLFGGTRIYKNMFNAAKLVECYVAADLDKEYSLDRAKLIRFAHLLGSDYTEGIPGIGPVTALEIITDFATLAEFKDWCANKRIFLPPHFPDPRVDHAYLHPDVDQSPEPFQWGVPDVDKLRAFLMATVGWSQDRTDEILVPVESGRMKNAYKRLRGEAERRRKRRRRRAEDDDDAEEEEAAGDEHNS